MSAVDRERERGGCLMAAQPTTHDDEYLTAELGKQRGEYIKEGCSLIRSSSSRWTLGKWGKIYSTHPRSPHLLCTVPPLCHEKEPRPCVRCENRIETNLSVSGCHLNSIRWATLLTAIDPSFHGDDDVAISSSWEGVLVSQQVALNNSVPRGFYDVVMAGDMEDATQITIQEIPVWVDQNKFP